MVKYFTAKCLSFLAVFTAIVFIATLLFRFPNPLMGYSNLGDAFIFLIAAFFGPLHAPKKDADSWKKEVHHDENNPT